MIGGKKMAFRIKNTYQFRCKQNYDGKYLTEIPEMIFSKSDNILLSAACQEFQPFDQEIFGS